MGEPVNARAALARRQCIDVFDQLAADPGFARGGRDKKVLQVAIIAGSPAGTVPDMVHQPDGDCALPRQRTGNGLCGVKQSGPRQRGTGGGMSTA